MLHKTALSMLLLVTLVGATDAALGGVWDHFVVFAFSSAVEIELLRPPESATSRPAAR